MSRRLLIICTHTSAFDLRRTGANAVARDAMTAARSLVTTLGLSDQYKALLPGILLRPQARADTGKAGDRARLRCGGAEDGGTYATYYNAMVDTAASVYANEFLRRTSCARSRRSIAAGRTEASGKVASYCAADHDRWARKPDVKATEALRARFDRAAAEAGALGVMAAG